MEKYAPYRTILSCSLIGTRSNSASMPWLPGRGFEEEVMEILEGVEKEMRPGPFVKVIFLQVRETFAIVHVYGQ